MIAKALLYFACLLFFCLQCFAQPYYFKKFEAEDGISNNSVINALQDKKGFLWFGTPDGLNRYDGRNFKIFKNYGRPGDLQSNAIYYLHEDQKGTLWVGTEKGLFRYDENLRQFQLIGFTRNKTIRAIQSDANGGLWIAEASGIYIYHHANNSIGFYPYSFLRGATSLAKSKDGLIWIGCRSAKLASYNLKSNTFKIYDIKIENSLSTIEKILPVNDESIFVGTSSHGLKILNRKTNHFYNANIFPPNKIFIHDILQYKPAEFWIATETGLYIYNHNTKTTVALTKDRMDPYSISDNAVYSLCKDQEGGVWVGTYFGGLNYYSNPQFLIKKSFPAIGKNSIAGNVVRTITQDRHKNIWIGTEDAGVSKFNINTNQFEDPLPIRSQLPSTNVHGLLTDGDELYVGTFEHGLYIFNYATGALKGHYYATSISSLKSNYINTILKRNENEILLGTSNGLYSFDKQHNNLKEIKTIPLNKFVSAITIDSSKNIWLGFHTEGVLFIDSNNNVKQLTIRSTGTNKNLLKETRILNFYFDNLNNLWICTENGLYKVNIKGGQVKQYNHNSGFPSNIIYAIVQDKLKNYWTTTSKGLVRIDYNNGDVKIFRKSDGLLAEQFNHHSSFVDDSGNIYFGSLKGIIKFNPVDYRKSNFIAPIYADEIRLLSQSKRAIIEQEKNQRSLASENKIVLPSAQASFNVSFSVLSFKSPDNIYFAYKLEPADKTWNQLGKTNQISFTNLPPGDYRLKIKSTNSSGLWLSNEKVVEVIITPPLWQSKPAYFIYMLLFICMVAIITSYIIHRNKRKHAAKMQAFAIKKEKELYEAKIDFYTNVAHEIKTPLSLIKAPLEKIRQHTQPGPVVSKYMDIVNKNTNRLLELSGQLLDLRKFESENYHVNFDKLDIFTLTKDIFDNFQNYADDRNIAYRFNCVENPIYIHADEEAVKKIVSNLLENAIKYSDGMAEISIIKSKKGQVEIFFVNDGNLIPEEEQLKIFEPFYRSRVNSRVKGSGVGLSLAKSLANLNNGDIVYRTDNKKNIFIFSVPEN